jgi:hypothetical protein
MLHMPDFIGTMVSPNQQYKPVIGIEEGRKWAMDNNAFTTGFDMKRLERNIESHTAYRSTCLFIVLPDVVGSAEQTYDLYLKWRDQFKETRFPIAYVLQDGQETVPIPEDVDCWFLGGTNKFKFDWGVWKMLLEGKSKGKWIHIGRVNSYKRTLVFSDVADSVDGNMHRFGPDKNLKKIIKWMTDANTLIPKQKHMIWNILKEQ